MTKRVCDAGWSLWLLSESSRTALMLNVSVWKNQLDPAGRKADKQFVSNVRINTFSLPVHSFVSVCSQCSTLMLIESAKDSLSFSVTHYKHPKQPHTVQVRPSAPVLHLSSTCAPPVRHLSTNCPVPVLHLSSTYPVPVLHQSSACPPPV